MKITTVVDTPALAGHKFVFYVFLCGLQLFGIINVGEAATQTIQLKQGGNYVGFTITPNNPAPPAIFGGLGDTFVQVSTMDNVSKKWTFYRNRNKFSIPADVDATNAIDPMTNVTIGRGYYVEMSAAATLTVNGAAPTNIQPITLQPGQNFVCPVIPGLTAPIGLSDLLNGPDYNLDSAHLLNGALHVQFTNNDTSDDTAFSIQPGEALFIESKSTTPITFTPALQLQPLVYFEQSTPFVVESPMAGAGGTGSINIPVRLSRPYIGLIRFGLAGTARFMGDYSFPSLSPTPENSVGAFSVASGISNLSLPLTIISRPTIQANTSAIFTLRRPQETGIPDAATLPQFVEVKITDGMNGIYEGVLKNQATSSNFEAQGIRLALRSNGTAVFEPAEGGMISSRFSIPYTISASGIPQLSSNTVVTLSSQATLGRIVTMLIQPGSTVLLPQVSGLPPGYEIPMTLTLTNLVASGPVQILSSLTLSQVNSALSNP